MGRDTSGCAAWTSPKDNYVLADVARPGQTRGHHRGRLLQAHDVSTSTA
jgi:hypothetical protein